MKKFAALLLIAGLVCGLSTSVAAAQSAGATVTGKAVRWDGSPISGATIAVLSGPLETAPELGSTTTGPDGTYTIAAPVGQPVWVHIRTFGTWWGYSYTPLNLRAGEVLSQVYFALGPRDVKEAIVLPTPISNIGPEVGTEQPPAAPPAPPEVSNVKPIIGVGDESPATQPVQKPQTKPQSNVKPLVGGNLPKTGADSNTLLTLVLALAAAGLVLGLGLRRQGSVQR